MVPVGYFDRWYPSQLSGVTDAPPLIFLRGDLTAEDQNGVAIIGTRRPSPSGIEVASRLTDELVQAGRTVISGLAAGIDTTAHATALRAGGRSIAVLGTGLQRVYPTANADLQRRLQVLVTQFWPEQGPLPDSFRQRNALMSAISSATVIAEAGERSGVRIQARHAIAQGRPLILMASLLRQDWARALASQAGVRVIDRPDELLGALHP